jgi:hypothetical protein
MKKVPITDIINSWLKADARLEEKCKEEICEYDSNSSYKGYMLGFEDGVQSQIDDDASKCIITKQDIVDGFKQFKSDSHFIPAVSEADCMQYISSSDQYWFFAGAMWLMNQLKNKIDGDR